MTTDATADLTTDQHPWDALVSAALLGAARRPVDPSTLPGAVGEVGARLPETDPAARLLDAAALLTVARRAGLRPETRAVPAGTAPLDGTARDRAALDRAPLETAPLVSRAAAARLDGLLSGARDDADALLDQWLDAAGRRGLRVPPDRLPALLDWAARRTHRTAVLPVLGERGRWLAAHRDRWARTLDRADAAAPTQTASPETSSVDSSSVDTTWTHGTPLERQRWFGALRRADAAAARAALLALDWNRQDGDSRLAFVEALARGLDLPDEEVLDRALADRRKDVRAVATHLLARVPGGRFQVQAAARALACVRVEHPPRPSLMARRPGPRIVVTLPDAGDTTPWPAGMLETPRGTGDRAWLLRHLVETTPLHLWTQSTGLSPEALLALPVADDLADVLHLGWARAAVRESDPTWARLLAPSTTGGLSVDLLRLLPPAERVGLVVTTLASDTAERLGDQPADPAAALAAAGRRHAVVGSALASVAGPWPAPVVDAVLRWLTGSPSPAHEHSAVARQASRDLPTDTGTESRLRAAAGGLPPDDPRRRTILTLADTLLYRRQMIEELQ
ncbi:DUF5691 domain-containing protein [Sanguibacter sp. 25GB23B1]|uniref:DUF5691 domain-containing protein n=1 Tax=unclassified Sanguibacter TaxID=2645534 RepID=UPI0032B0117B